MYSPIIGRFAQRDPIQADANLYRYVNGNPENWVDPSGEQASGSGTGKSWDPGNDDYAHLKEGITVPCGNTTATIKVSEGRRTANKQEYDAMIFNVSAKNYDFKEVRVVQFIYRVHGDYEGSGDRGGDTIYKYHKYFGDGSEREYSGTNKTDMSNRWITDNFSRKTITASEGNPLVTRTDTSLDFWDAPVMPRSGKRERAVVATYIFCGGDVVYAVKWERRADEQGNLAYVDPHGGQPLGRKLPGWAMRTLSGDAQAPAEANRFVPREEGNLWHFDPDPKKRRFTADPNPGYEG